jgi:hypothetical protein
LTSAKGGALCRLLLFLIIKTNKNLKVRGIAMIEALVGCDLITFAEFIEWYPEDGKRYELYRGLVTEMMPIGDLVAF